MMAAEGLPGGSAAADFRHHNRNSTLNQELRGVLPAAGGPGGDPAAGGSGGGSGGDPTLGAPAPGAPGVSPSIIGHVPG